MDTVFVNTLDRARGLEKEGYAIISIAYFLCDGRCTYQLEKGSAWSRTLGSQ